VVNWYKADLEWDPEERVWVAYVRDLGGLSTYGETLSEVLAQTRDILGDNYSIMVPEKGSKRQVSKHQASKHQASKRE